MCEVAFSLFILPDTEGEKIGGETLELLNLGMGEHTEQKKLKRKLFKLESIEIQTEWKMGVEVI